MGAHARIGTSSTISSVWPGSRPAGPPTRAIVVEAPTQVEPMAEATPCPLCDGPMRLTEHAAETHDGTRLRVAHVRCSSCGVARARYFRLAGYALN